MPLPDSPLVINGGCNCRAVRYKITIPHVEERPLHPAADAASGPVRLPFVCTDHCNDCRRATGAVLPYWICTPIAMVTSSLILRDAAFLHPDASKRDDALAEKRSPWLPATRIFEPGPASTNSFLDFYESSAGRRRSFCGRCGTMVAYAALPMPHGWPDMLDIVLGTVDREDLERDSLAPERQLWWEKGIHWVQKFSESGAVALPKHPDYRINEFAA